MPEHTASSAPRPYLTDNAFLAVHENGSQFNIFACYTLVVDYAEIDSRQLVNNMILFDKKKDGHFAIPHVGCNMGGDEGSHVGKMQVG